MAPRGFSLLLACDDKGGIGKGGQLPWRLKSEMQHFKDLSTKVPEPKSEAAKAAPKKRNAVIMGRKTWDSIPQKFRPLPDRLNIIVSNSIKEPMEGTVVCPGLTEALSHCSQPEVANTIHKVFVTGGEGIFKLCFEQFRPLIREVQLTRVEGDLGCDVFFPLSLIDQPPPFQAPFKLRDQSEPMTEEDGISKRELKYRFERYTCQNLEEEAYLQLIHRIIETGNDKGDRTGVGTMSVFGAQARYSLRQNVFPLLTTKRVFWKGVAEELFWFIRGETNGNTLLEKNIKIWEGNGSKEFLEKSGLGHREENDLGPIYGFQWRHFGAEYSDMHADYTGKGVDQLTELIRKIKENPNDRRLIMSAWNPAALHEMALPPCHVFSQFYVSNGELSCMMYQRSCDMGLGVPFNIASYALLTRLIAKVCGLQPGEFIHTMGDTHVYKNHIDALKGQLERTPKVFPTLEITKESDNIEDYAMGDLLLLDYFPDATVKMEMAV